MQEIEKQKTTIHTTEQSGVDRNILLMFRLMLRKKHDG